MTRRLPLALLSLGLAASLAACGKPEPAEKPQERARTVRVVPVESRALAGALAASGDLIPREEAAVAPEVSGYRVARVLVDVGDYVRVGQVLAQLDPALMNAEVARAEANAAQAEAQALQAESEAKRVEGLDGQGVLSQEQIDQRRFQARAARATANAQAASLRDARTRAGKLAVTAPVSGLVLERNVRPGDLAAAGATPWFRLARDGQIELAAQLSEDDLARVRPGQQATVTLQSGQTATGVVRLVSPQIDPQTKLGVARLTLPVRPDIRAGGYARAAFADAAGVGLAVPETAVRYDADGASVMVVQADNKVRRVTVQAGPRAGGYVQLLKGPPAGSRVVQSAGAFLLDGDLVRPVDGAAAPASAPQPKAAR